MSEQIADQTDKPNSTLKKGLLTWAVNLGLRMSGLTPNLEWETEQQERRARTQEREAIFARLNPEARVTLIVSVAELLVDASEHRHTKWYRDGLLTKSRNFRVTPRFTINPLDYGPLPKNHSQGVRVCISAEESSALPVTRLTLTNMHDLGRNDSIIHVPLDESLMHKTALEQQNIHSTLLALSEQMRRDAYPEVG